MKQSPKKEWLSWTKSILLALVVVLLCRHFLFSPVMVKGISMEPTFEDQNRVIISKISDIQAFDLIVFDSPISSDQHIKRVIGLPGDEIEIKEDILTINGIPYHEPYLEQNKEKLLFNEPLTGDFYLKVPENSLFVLGDNRRKSMDSREYGVISEEAVLGEVKVRIFPFSEMDWFQ
ncbi:signal peptidase I [Jeotgalibacillus campisalis]|uniref:Signal peptidase I n=1 Tax=Jeotgalibacillus campisalis TaxID=220754 RepID=A0A0C2SB05_9BACL|nr:signal peptidase I [Jeotgalibacillus campisalis]KIL51124.1 signal peptidase [Jeotgalibacillus campisalis]